MICAHVRDCSSEEANCGKRILIVDLTPHGFRCRYNILKTPPPATAGVIYQDIYSTPTILNRIHYSHNVSLAGDVGGHTETINVIRP